MLSEPMFGPIVPIIKVLKGTKGQGFKLISSEPLETGRKVNSKPIKGDYSMINL